MNKNTFFFLKVVFRCSGWVVLVQLHLDSTACYPLRHNFCNTAYEAAEGSSALLLMCWWSEKEQFLISASKIFPVPVCGVCAGSNHALTPPFPPSLHRRAFVFMLD